MRNIKTLSRSFAGGILAPELYGRLDLAKYQTGLAECRNFIVMPHGPIQSRAGFEYVRAVKDSTKATRIIPFTYSTTQTMVIELGAGYFRFHTQGATLLSPASPSAWVTTTAYAVGALVTQTGTKYYCVTAHTSGTFATDLAAGKWYALPATGEYEIPNDYAEADLFDIHYVQSADVLTLVHPGYPPKELRRYGATDWRLASISFVPTISAPAAPTLAEALTTGTPIDVSYKITALADGTLEESVASASATINTDLNAANNYVTVTITPVSGAVRYNVYKLSNGLYGYIGQTDGTAFKDNNITADTSTTPPTVTDPFATSGNYPGAVGYFEQRRIFAGTTNGPQNMWMTRSGTESSMAYSIPTRDDDRIALRIASRDANTIRHIVPVDQLLFLTSSGEWKIAPQNSDIITPTTVAPKQVSTEGAANVQPAITSNAVIYVHESGCRMRELKYKWESNGYTVNDISIMAPHLFDGYTIDDLTYSKAPDKIVWCVRSDGKLIGLTYLPEHDVAAWHEHDTLGSFESVACVKEGAEYTLYAVILREVDGSDVRYVERLHTRRFDTIADAFFVDSGLTYDSTPATSITGLDHLEGCDVAVLADGAEVTGLTVASGSITLPYAASVVHVGLPITADAKTLPLSFEAPAFGQGYVKNVNEVTLRVKDSSGFRVGPSFDDTDLVEWTTREAEPYGTPPALRDGIVDITVMPSWDADAALCIRQTAPLPVTVLSMVLDVAVGS